MNLFGFSRKGAKLELVTDASEQFLCHHYRLLEIPSSSELVATYRLLSKQHPDHRFLLTLDDFGQACYTSMHSKMSHDLDETEGFDLSGLPEQCFEDGNHTGWLTVLAEFHIRVANFRKGCSGASWDDITEKRVRLFDQSIDEFVAANRDFRSVMDREAYFLKVPVQHSYETMAAFPNGYFTSDLNPFENFLFAKSMHDDFGYDLFGMGASHIAFLKSKELDSAELGKLLALLARVYPADCDEWERPVREVVEARETLMLRYTE